MPFEQMKVKEKMSDFAMYDRDASAFDLQQTPQPKPEPEKPPGEPPRPTPPAPPVQDPDVVDPAQQPPPVEDPGVGEPGPTPGNPPAVFRSRKAHTRLTRKNKTSELGHQGDVLARRSIMTTIGEA